MKYNEQKINEIYQANLSNALLLLSSLPIAEGRNPNFSGLNGWLFEQTIRSCLSQELASRGLVLEITEQAKLGGRRKIDLLVGKTAIELKYRGSFGAKVDEKYIAYKKEAYKRGWDYCYLAGSETYAPYRLATIKIFGSEATFYLDKTGDWERFTEKVIDYNGHHPRRRPLTGFPH